MNCYKRTALYLHGLDQNDRLWFLERLNEIHSSKLVSLIRELDALGVPSSPLYLDDLKTVARSSKEPRDGDQALDKWIGIIDQSDITLIDRLLKQEPTIFTSLLLSLHSWRWRKDYLAQLGLRERREIESTNANRSRQVTDHLKHTMLAKLAETLSECGDRPLVTESFDRHNKFEVECAKQQKNKKWLGLWRR